MKARLSDSVWSVVLWVLCWIFSSFLFSLQNLTRNKLPRSRGLKVDLLPSDAEMRRRSHSLSSPSSVRSFPRPTMHEHKATCFFVRSPRSSSNRRRRHLFFICERWTLRQLPQVSLCAAGPNQYCKSALKATRASSKLLAGASVKCVLLSPPEVLRNKTSRRTSFRKHVANAQLTRKNACHGWVSHKNAEFWRKIIEFGNWNKVQSAWASTKTRQDVAQLPQQASAPPRQDRRPRSSHSSKFEVHF